MPIVTLAQIRGRGRGRRGRGRGTGRGRGYSRQEAEPEPKKPFQGSSHSLLEGVPADEEGHDPELDGLGTNKQKEAMQGDEVIDLCDSDAEEVTSAQARSKRSCPADRSLGIRSPAAASTSGRAQPQCRPSAQQTERRRNWGGQAGKSADSSWMYGGDGAYVPDPNAAPDMRLRLWETVQVLDVGLVRHPASALLDSGNAGHTLIKMGLAKQLDLVDQSGWPTQAGGRTTTVRGVVAGATEKVPLMNLTYELQGKKMHVTVGVTNASLGCDLLISQREISEFISDGFIFDVR
ncbi:hypothetical protein WJX75_007368 [Coccomyxa subellipsoidea]|uniref:Aspartic peptidase DDI1-type domain-containing protein n=1 Tax=Coccomyxa subellipsoidea TaxID=248742 RepID=A0ABR2YSD7_9CHLO